MTAGVRSPELDAYETQTTSLERFAGYFTTTTHLDATDAGAIDGRNADLEFFSLLGVDALVGRTFRAGDPLDVAVISARLWERRFDRDPQLPGQTVVLDGRPRAIIVGVMPDAFQFPYRRGVDPARRAAGARTDIWIPD